MLNPSSQEVPADVAKGIATRRRNGLVVVLTFVTGCADATGFLALGGAFSSVMTGNMVLLGMSVGTGKASMAVNSGSAIVAYILGVLIGSWVTGRPSSDDPVWPRAVNRALGIELAVFVVVGIAWEINSGTFARGEQIALLMAMAASLGIQSSAVQRFGVSGLSSTYLTGTLTTLIGGVAARRPLKSLLPSAQVLLALIVGAAVGAVVIEHAHRFVPLLWIVPMVCVIALSGRLNQSVPPAQTEASS